jgi:hypothetical protein
MQVESLTFAAITIKSIQGMHRPNMANQIAKQCFDSDVIGQGRCAYRRMCESLLLSLIDRRIGANPSNIVP